MSRVYNFSAGPGVLPEDVLKQAQAEMLEWQGSGMSVMEMSHRDKYFMSIAEQAEADLRDIMGIPANYKVLFLQGGASLQFAMLPMNLLATNNKADYIQTGQWSEKAIAEAKRYGTVNVVASTQDSNYTTVPTQASLATTTDAAYLHYTPNETIVGVEFPYIPQSNVPIIADMSSTILSRPIDVSKFAVIYAGAQKNIGPAGLTLVIIREDLIGKAMDRTPVMLNYKTHATESSMYNTPPTFGWYFAGLVFKWIKNLGGLQGMAAINKRKAEKLYAAIDGSSFYTNPVDKSCRSWMNVPFILANAEQDKAFLAGAEKAGLTTLKGHRSVGGMRASIYNAMPESGVDALISYMKEFEKKNG